MEKYQQIAVHESKGKIKYKDPRENREAASASTKSKSFALSLTEGWTDERTNERTSELFFSSSHPSGSLVQNLERGVGDGVDRVANALADLGQGRGGMVSVLPEK